MSLIASFWTLDKCKLDELMEKAQPYQKETVRKNWFFSKVMAERVYPWHDYLKENAREEKEFGLSGMVMADFDLMLSEVSRSLFELGLPESEKLSEFSGGTAALLDHKASALLVKNVSSFNLTEKGVRKFYDEDERPEEWRYSADELAAAGETITSWCKEVTAEKLGLLIIG